MKVMTKSSVIVSPMVKLVTGVVEATELATAAGVAKLLAPDVVVDTVVLVDSARPVAPLTLSGLESYATLTVTVRSSLASMSCCRAAS